jgi:hypothetical protein
MCAPPQQRLSWWRDEALRHVPFRSLAAGNPAGRWRPENEGRTCHQPCCPTCWKPQTKHLQTSTCRQAPADEQSKANRGSDRFEAALLIAARMKHEGVRSTALRTQRQKHAGLGKHPTNKITYSKLPIQVTCHICIHKWTARQKGTLTATGCSFAAVVSPHQSSACLALKPRANSEL